MLGGTGGKRRRGRQRMRWLDGITGWMASLTRWTWVWVNSGSGDGQGGLACCDSWGCKEMDTTEQLIWSDLIMKYWYVAAAANSLQLCPTLCDPIDSSPPGSPIQCSCSPPRQEHWSGLPFPSPMHESKKWKRSHSVVFDSQRPHGLQPTRILRPWNFPGKSTGVGCHCLLLSSLNSPQWQSHNKNPGSRYSCIRKKHLIPTALLKTHVSHHDDAWTRALAQMSASQVDLLSWQGAAVDLTLSPQFHPLLLPIPWE